MIHVYETTRVIPFYQPIPLTNLPLIYHREHLFPYTSYGDTKTTSIPRTFRAIILENEYLRVEVIPELGGRVYSLLDKRIEKEILFSNPVVKPVRILPIWGFISGGIEFNFPIAHSPTSLATVGSSFGQTNDYGFVRVGEREARTGMEWVVELGLVAESAVLIQRTALRNHTRHAHPWMMWTIAAMKSTEQTEFVHPPGRVLLHDDRVIETDWPGEGLNWNRNANQMTAFFWKPNDAPCFGVFHHEQNHGLIHLAPPKELPGKKIWTYGCGKHRIWSQDTTIDKRSYVEMESGPLLDQGEKPLFPPGEERLFQEFWIPVHSKEECVNPTLPKLHLPPMTDPWLGWKHSPWQSEWEQFKVGKGPLPSSCVPTGIELEDALRREQSATEPLALCLAFRQRPDEALLLVENDPKPEAQRIAGLILWKVLEKPREAVTHLEAGPLNDPVAVVELDELYTELDQTQKRVELLTKAPAHRLVIERRANLALTLQNPKECIRLLTNEKWPREHQRYTRTELWREAKKQLGEKDSLVPTFLNEDNLASFGAYWSD